MQYISIVLGGILLAFLSLLERNKPVSLYITDLHERIAQAPDKYELFAIKNGIERELDDFAINSLEREILLQELAYCSLRIRLMEQYGVA